MELGDAVKKFFKDLGPRAQLFGLLKSVVVPALVALIEGIRSLQGEPVVVPVWGYGVLFLVSAVVVLFWLLFDRLREFETRAEVNLNLGDPYLSMKPGDQKRYARRYSLRVENHSDREIKNVQLKMIQFTNAYDKETNFQNMRFSVRDTGVGSTEIASHDFEIFHIALKDEGKDGVEMQYAGGKQTIPNHYFPHQLTVKLTADGLCVPQERSFELRIEDKKLVMEKKWA